MTDRKKDVLTRLDSLLQNNNNGDSKSNAAQSPIVRTASPKVGGILKAELTKRSNGGGQKKKRNIRFPEREEELHEVIGYGGDMQQFGGSDDDDEADEGPSIARNRRNNNGRPSDEDEAVTVEERNILNLTKKNTNFNSRSQNLSVDGGVRLGAEKKPAPLITVRPFVRDHSPGKVNKVSPMINGEVVQKIIDVVKDTDRNDKKPSSDKVTSFSSNFPRQRIENSASNKSHGSVGSAAGGGGSSDDKQVKQNINVKRDEKDSAALGRKQQEDKVEEKSPVNSQNSNSTTTTTTTVSSRNSRLAAARLSFLNTMSSPSSAPSHDDVDGGDEKLQSATVTKSVSCKKNNNDLISHESENETSTASKMSTAAHVKLARKSPFVPGLSNNPILKGTPKPLVVVKKPPLPKEKPKLPEKPKIILSSSKKLSQASNKVEENETVPKRSSFRQNKAPAPKVPSEVTISDNSNIELNNETASGTNAEIYSSEADTQSEVIFEVNATRAISQSSFAENNEIKTETGELDHQQLQQPTKNKTKEEALASIRKSLEKSNSIDDHKRMDDKQDNVSSSENDDAYSSHKSFADKRSAIANSLFNRVERSSTKRQAPKPPPKEADEEKDSEIEQDSREICDEPPSSSSMSSESGNDSGEINSKDHNTSSVTKKNVQFSPDTKKEEETVSKKLPEPISYNKWITQGGIKNGVVESSFTGQPIQVLPPSVPKQQQQKSALDKSTKKSPTTYAPHHLRASPSPQHHLGQHQTVMDDEVRKWTEKKRSKSVQPRGSEIDEIMGSSKAKQKTRFFGALPSSVGAVVGGVGGGDGVSVTPAIRRQSRVELYEEDRKKILSSSKSHNRFSLSKIFNKLTNSNSALNTADSSPNQTNGNFMDEEHGREIVEREKSKLRPNIIHPIDLNSGGVEVVTIRPKNTQQQAGTTSGHFEKHRSTGVFNGSTNSGGGVGTTKSILKAKVEYVDSKDSGHETSSIHTENSDSSSGSDAGNSRSPSSLLEDPQNGFAEPLSSFEQQIIKPARINGRLKPIPPPRSNSLDQNFDSSSSCTSNSNDEMSYNNNVIGTAHEISPYASTSIFMSSSSTSMPPTGYILPGKMNLGAGVNIRALNSANLRPMTASSEHHSVPAAAATEGVFPSSSSRENFYEEWKHQHDQQPLTRNGKPSEEDGRFSGNDIFSSKSSNHNDIKKMKNIIYEKTVVSANLQVLTQILQQAVICEPPNAVKLKQEFEKVNRNLCLRDFHNFEEKLLGEELKIVDCEHSSTSLKLTLVGCVHKYPILSNFTPLAEFKDDFVDLALKNKQIQGEHYFCVFNRFDTLQNGDSLYKEGKITPSNDKDICYLLHDLIDSSRSDVLDVNFVFVAREAGALHYRCTSLITSSLSIKTEGKEMEKQHQKDDDRLSHLLEFFSSLIGGDLNACSEEMKFVFKLLKESADMQSIRNVLEHILWGPPSTFGLEELETENLENWLNLERAQLLNKIISQKGLHGVAFSHYEKCQLDFLVHGASDIERLKITSQKLMEAKCLATTNL